MDHAHEQAIWKAIGENNGSLDELRDEIDSLRAPRLRARYPSFMIGLFCGYGLVLVVQTVIAVFSHEPMSASDQLKSACWREARGDNRPF